MYCSHHPPRCGAAGRGSSTRVNPHMYGFGWDFSCCWLTFSCLLLLGPFSFSFVSIDPDPIFVNTFLCIWVVSPTPIFLTWFSCPVPGSPCSRGHPIESTTAICCDPLLALKDMWHALKELINHPWDALTEIVTTNQSSITFGGIPFWELVASLQTPSMPSDSLLGGGVVFLKTGTNQPSRPEGKKFLIFLCNVSWPQYKPPDQEVWALLKTPSYNIIFQLDLFCQNSSKWSEFSYVQDFMTLSQNTGLLKNCRMSLAQFHGPSHPVNSY